MREAIVAALDFPDRAHAWLGKVWEKELDENELRDSEVFSTLDAKILSALTSWKGISLDRQTCSRRPRLTPEGW